MKDGDYEYFDLEAEAVGKLSYMSVLSIRQPNRGQMLVKAPMSVISPTKILDRKNSNA